jgi:hypothetical protein
MPGFSFFSSTYDKPRRSRADSTTFACARFIAGGRLHAGAGSGPYGLSNSRLPGRGDSTNRCHNRVGNQSLLEINIMDYINFLQDAIERVDALNISETEWSEAVLFEAQVFANENVEASFEIPVTSPYQPLRF